MKYNENSRKKCKISKVENWQRIRHWERNWQMRKNKERKDFKNITEENEKKS